jgi:hypothetical protein
MMFVCGVRNTDHIIDTQHRNTPKPVRSGQVRGAGTERDKGASSGELVGEVLGGEAMGRVGSARGEGGREVCLGDSGRVRQVSPLVLRCPDFPSLYLSSIGCQENFKISDEETQPPIIGPHDRKSRCGALCGEWWMACRSPRWRGVVTREVWAAGEGWRGEEKDHTGDTKRESVCEAIPPLLSESRRGSELSCASRRRVCSLGESVSSSGAVGQGAVVKNSLKNCPPHSLALPTEHEVR